MRRRQFLKSVAASAPVVLLARKTASASLPGEPVKGKAHRADLAVIGGGTGGCAAALAAAKLGLRVILTEETGWIGGQLTSQAVPPDEHRWIETHGANRGYRELRNGIRDYYRRHYPLTDQARANEFLNPGAGGVSRLCHEPRVALAVLYEMMAPHIASGRLKIFLHHRPVAAETSGDKIKSVMLRDALSGVERSIEAPWFVDATELGDLLPLSGTEYVTGSESRRETGELHAPEEARPDNMQAITWCFPMEYVPNGDFVADPPANYAFWRDFVPDLTPPWPGRLLSFTYSHPRTLQPRTLAFDPATEASGWWTYRRIAHRANFQPGAYDGSITLVNWPQNDYFPGHLMGPEEETRKHLEGARQLSLSLFHWMQTEAPRPDGGTGWPGLRLRPGLVGTADGLAMAPYIREARRIRAEFTVLEQHVGTQARRELLGRPEGPVKAESFSDSIGVGTYAIDLHPSTGGINYIDIPSLPFQIPLGCLIPRRMENLLAAAKNIGTTHITNGCYRLHPVEWNIGEAAGALTAWCSRKKTTPRQTRNSEKLLREFQSMLVDLGAELAWED